MAEEKSWKKYYNPEVANRATSKYQKEKMRTIGVKFHLKNDADILAKLDDVPNKVNYIRQLIREDILRTGWKPPMAMAELPPKVPTAEPSPEALAEARRLMGLE